MAVSKDIPVQKIQSVRIFQVQKMTASKDIPSTKDDSQQEIFQYKRFSQ
jgi:hypothetical protein